MKNLYQNLEFTFLLESIPVQVLTMAVERRVDQVPSHSHGPGCYEVHYITAGLGKLKLPESSYTLFPGTLYVVGPSREHAEISLPGQPIYEYCLYFKIQKNTAGKTPMMEQFLSQSLWIGTDRQELLQVLQAIAGELEKRSWGYQEQISALLKQFLVGLIRNCHTLSGDHKSEESMDLTHQRSVIAEDYFLYEYQTLSLGELSHRLGLSKRQTERFLKEFYGKTFLQKRREARMSAASVLLTESQSSITEISEKLGYSSLEHFTTAFRKHYGTSPRDFRKKQLHF